MMVGLFWVIVGGSGFILNGGFFWVLLALGELWWMVVGRGEWWHRL